MLDCSTAGVATLDCLPNLFQNIISWLLYFAGAAAVFLIILSGIKFITSGGEAKQAEEARKTLTYAVIGLVVILLAFFIISIISHVTGVACIFKPFGLNTCL